MSVDHLEFASSRVEETFCFEFYTEFLFKGVNNNQFAFRYDSTLPSTQSYRQTIESEMNGKSQYPIFNIWIDRDNK
jgi:hypothetical protein